MTHPILRHLAVRGFAALERLGFHVLPSHYYSPVSDRRALRQTAALWQRPTVLHGVDWDLEGQLRWARAVVSEHLTEIRDLDVISHLEGFGPGYGPIEAQFLHCFIRAASPKRIVEIGGGVTTALMIRAGELNSPPPIITYVEPFPSARLKELPVTLLTDPLQAVDLDVFQQLDASDLLFIDSSHAVKTGSDVQRTVLEIIPTRRFRRIFPFGEKGLLKILYLTLDAALPDARACTRGRQGPSRCHRRSAAHAESNVGETASHFQSGNGAH